MRRAYLPYSLRAGRRHRRRNFGKPEQERNIPAAFFSLVVGGIFAVAMAEPNWLSVNGGKCDGHHIGLYKIFGVGHHTEKELEAQYCMNNKVLMELKAITACCVLGIIFSLAQFSLDTWGVSAKGFKAIRRNATGDILAVLCSVVIMVLCYLVVLEIENTEVKAGKTVKVRLDIAFFLTVGSGVAAIIATTLNLLQCTCEKTGHAPSMDDFGMELMYDDLPDDIHLPPMPPPAYDL